MGQSEKGRIMEAEQKVIEDKEERTGRDKTLRLASLGNENESLKAENEKLTLPELVGQPTFSGSVSELVQETDTGLSSSTYPVSELLTSSQSPTVLSEEDQKWLFKERILKWIQ